uniref:Uncharacterized protein n=1 Tax=Podoviridae sp. ctXdu7 TaxID=2827618 RepID=A0A8S5RR67_9CAUD|nr:MAG TPA: hypothetical protein [Podoviridae sp. ctXdu7]
MVNISSLNLQMKLNILESLKQLEIHIKMMNLFSKTIMIVGSIVMTKT